MIFFMKCFKKRWFLISSIWMIGVLPAAAGGMDSEIDISNDLEMEFLISDANMVSILPSYTFGFTVITEGMTDFPLERQLTNFLPFDMDITLIIAIGWTGDKLTIEIEDEADYGDRLMAIAWAFYKNEMIPFWGTFYSKSSEKSFGIYTPVAPPGIVVLLCTGYQTPSIGEHPYKYTIRLSFRK